jgi:hypothetical protein
MKVPLYRPLPVFDREKITKEEAVLLPLVKGGGEGFKKAILWAMFMIWNSYGLYLSCL